MALKTSKDQRFALTKLSRKVTLQLTDIVNNNNKFYIAELFEGDGDWCIRTEYGRTGVTGTIDYRYGGEYQCEREMDRLIKSKEKKGYVKVETEDVAEEKTAPKKIIKKEAKAKKLDVPPNILRFVEYIFGQTTTYVEKNVQTPVGKLSKGQIDKGKEILAEIDDLISNIPGFADVGSKASITQIESDIKKSRKLPKLEKLCSQYYSSIPQKLGRNIRGFTALIKCGDDLAHQEEVLQALEDLLDVQEVAVSDDLAAKYESFEASFDDPDKAVKDKIIRFFNESQSGRHSAKLTIKDVITVKRDEDYKRWAENIAKIKTVQAFHGTRNQNLLGICSRGLLVPGKHISVASGAAFGVGIYGAIHSSKSAQYCGAGWRSSGNQYMFVMDMAVGKQHIHTGWVHGGWRGIPKDCHSTWAKSGKNGGGLAHDELIVYKENQARLTHIINFESKW